MIPHQKAQFYQTYLPKKVTQVPTPQAQCADANVQLRIEVDTKRWGSPPPVDDSRARLHPGVVGRGGARRPG